MPVLTPARYPAGALPIEIKGVATVADVTNVMLLAVPKAHQQVEVEAPRGSLRPGCAFALRYGAGGRPLRALARCLKSTPRPGMVDLCTLLIVAEPGEPRERVAVRA